LTKQRKKRRPTLTKERKAQSLQRAFRFASDKHYTLPLSKARQLVDNPPICPYCGVPIPWPNISVDHAVPRSRGGSSELDNLVWTDRRCNQLKGSLMPDEFRELQRFMSKDEAIRRDLESRLLGGGGWRYGRKK
jgi:5-methylcytosine-specific restriction endonuclease McrA